MRFWETFGLTFVDNLPTGVGRICGIQRRAGTFCGNALWERVMLCMYRTGGGTLSSTLKNPSLCRTRRQTWRLWRTPRSRFGSVSTSSTNRSGRKTPSTPLPTPPRTSATRYCETIIEAIIETSFYIILHQLGADFGSIWQEADLNNYAIFRIQLNSEWGRLMQVLMKEGGCGEMLTYAEKVRSEGFSDRFATVLRLIFTHA